MSSEDLLIREALGHIGTFDMTKIEKGAWPDTMLNLVTALAQATETTTND